MFGGLLFNTFSYLYTVCSNENEICVTTTTTNQGTVKEITCFVSDESWSLKTLHIYQQEKNQSLFTSNVHYLCKGIHQFLKCNFVNIYTCLREILCRKDQKVEFLHTKKIGLSNSTCHIVAAEVWFKI